MFKELYNKIKEWIMSLYLGASSSNTNILHITDTVTSESAIKSDTVLANTTFHSNLPYLQVLARSSCTVNQSYSFSGQWNIYKWTIKVPQNIIDLINAGYMFNILINTRYTYGKTISINSQSFFSKGTGVTSPWDYTRSGYSWGPTSNPYDSSWSDNISSPSSTNCYVDLINYGGVEYVQAYPLRGAAYYDSRQDYFIGSTADIVVYSILNSSIQLPSATTSVKLSPSEFIIGTTSGDVNMGTYYPIRYVDTATSTSFTTLTSNTNIEVPVINSSAVTGWNIDVINSSNPIIQKKLASGATETLISTDTGALSYSGYSEYTYSVYAANSVARSGNFFSVASNEIIIAFVEGTAYNSFVGTRSTKGGALFIDNTNSISYIGMGQGVTSSGTNANTYVDNYALAVQVESGLLSIRVEADKQDNLPNTRGITFSGVLKVFKFTKQS